MKVIVVSVAAVFALGACQTGPTASGNGPRATAALQPIGSSKASGEVRFEQVGANKVRVSVNVQGLQPGSEHGLHIHEKGDCSSEGMGAGGHFNPTGKPHGQYQSADHHAGDLPSLKADKEGRAKVDAELNGLTVTPGPSSVVGRGIIVHADPDDYKTQPTGNSGARIACGAVRES